MMPLTVELINENVHLDTVRDDLETLVLQILAHQLAELVVVIDDQDRPPLGFTVHVPTPVEQLSHASQLRARY